MRTRIANGRVLLDGAFRDTDVYFDEQGILFFAKGIGSDRTIDASGSFVTAGFIDLHCHGGAGYDFSCGDPEGIRKAALLHLQHGTTALFPTVTSSGFETMEQAVLAIEEAKKTLPMLQGIHLEGPYLSPAQMGAQNGEKIRRPEEKEYTDFLSRHRIARWDYAPELDPDFRFLDALKSHGVLPAAAHTDATCREMELASERGCRLVTHLYSCTSTIRRVNGFRIAGVTEAAYLKDEIDAELIADGCHLPDELLRLAYKLKGPERLALITDAMRAAGLPEEGVFDIGGVPCFVEDGVAKLMDRSAFAGSVATSDRLVRTCVHAGIPLVDSIRMITETPARIMGLNKKGALKAGNDADIVIFDRNIEMKTIIQGGRIAYGREDR
ncbi:MAG: amidohydrolase family protein [Lachnospiraceae bacterium]|nr:amidohydrolase family protein [Lachnospiraceae bacterium]